MGKVLMRPGGGSSDLDAITAKASDVLAGKAFVGSDGEIQSGTIPDFTTNKQATVGDKTIQLFDNLEKDGSNLVLKVTDGLKTGYIKSTDILGISGETAGNAVAKNVVVGNTFTSAAGVKLEGVLPNNSNSKKSDTIEVKQDVVLVRIPNGAYFNGADGKDPSIELSKLTVAKMATDMFGLSVITNFRLAQLYSNRVSMTWRLSPDERLSYDKSTFVDRNTKTRHGLCTGFKIDITAGGQSTTSIVPYNPNSAIYDYTSDVVPQGKVTVIITPFISLGLNDKLYGAMQQQSIVLNNINGSLSISAPEINKRANSGSFTVPAGVRYMAYVMVGFGTGGSDGMLITHNNSRDSYAGGGGGAGGKFKEGLIKVTPGETISYYLPSWIYDQKLGTIVVGDNRIVLTIENAGHVPFPINYSNEAVNTASAASGGSGGGAGSGENYGVGGRGGSNGSNGENSIMGSGGTGQGTTTRSKLTGVLYAGGGGGGGTYYNGPNVPFVYNGGDGGGGAGGDSQGSAMNGTAGLGAGGGGGGKYGANILNRGSRGAGSGGCGCIYLEWGDRVTETYKNEIMAMERG